MIVLGIDIGLTGAVAAIDHRGDCVIDDLPTLPVDGARRVKSRVDARALIHRIRDLVKPGQAAIALFEDVHVGMGPGSAARASLMHSRGTIEAVLDIARIESHIVQPPTWKRFYGLIGKDKRDSLAAAATLYPASAEMLKRQKDHNRAEAVLIAHYGVRTMA